MKIKTKRGDKAVSEIVGTILLLAISICVFSVVYLNVLSEDGPNPETYATIVGKMEPEGYIFNTVAFENRRGETLGPDTEIILTIYGEQKPPKKISDFTYLNGDWNIGEKIYPVFNLGDLSGTQIDATIFDKKSNSMVFWGRLQEGAVAPPPGRGGIWHFNESYWNGTKGEVKDSSGNGNHGTAKGGATTTTDAISIRSGSFNCRYNNYVEVIPKVPYSLNMNDKITVEAWMKPLKFDPRIETKEYTDLEHGYEPDIIHVSGDIYAIACRSTPKHRGMLSTLTISSEGLFSDDLMDCQEFDSKTGYVPKVVHISGNIFVIAYSTSNYPSNPRVVLKTVTIDPISGDISDIPLDTFELPNRGYEPNIIPVSGNIYAIVCSGPDEDGYLVTVRIDSISGNISDYPIDYLEFDKAKGYEPNIIPVSGDYYAIAYRNLNDTGCLISVIIDSISGNISDYPIDYLEFDTLTKGDDKLNIMDIIHISGDYYAIAYRNLNDTGCLISVTIDSTNGNISDGFIDKEEFEIDNCQELDMIHTHNEIYAIIYTKGNGTGNTQGVLIELEISSETGLITYSGEPVLTDIGIGKVFEPKIFLISPQLYTIAYRDQSSHPFHITTIRSKDPTLPWYRGIFKFGSVNIYADENSAYASLVTAEDNFEHHMQIDGIIPENWYYIVLTFDGSTIRFYCNKQGDDFSIKPDVTYSDKEVSPPTTPKTIKIPENSKLYFGYLFYGYIDEVAIHNKVLTDNDPTSLSSVQYHFGNPGFFENEI
jgi:hypothetical protein